MGRLILASLGGLAALGVAWCAMGAAAITPITPITVGDDRGKTVSLAGPAARIVTLSPHLAEIAFAAGAGASLVGVSARSDFPEDAQRLPVVSDSGRIDLERVVALKPDLVLAWLSGNPARQLELLERRGIAVLAVEVRRLDDIPRVLRLVGTAAGRGEAAEQVARQAAQSISGLSARYAGLRKLRVFIEIWHEPLITVSGGHLISDVLQVCGGENVYAGAGALTPAVSPETLLVLRPEVVIMSSGAGTEAEQAGRWRRRALLPAVQQGALYELDPDLLHRQGPRLIEAARTVCEHLERARAAQGRRG
jgi:iron complex transport system substrate-binding protein